VVPLLYSIYTSFFTTRLIGGTTFTGFQNYVTIFESGQFWGGMLRVIIFAAVQIPIMLALALFFATLFDLGVIPGGSVFRTVFFLPFAVPAVVGSIMWGFLLEPHFGALERILGDLGLAHNANLLSTGLVLPAIIMIVIWEWTGYNMIIFFTALRAVPKEVVEAAVVDGATLRTIIFRVKLPLVRPAVLMLGLLNLIGALQLFTEPSIIGSFTSSISFGFTPAIFLYNTAIGDEQYNLAAAGAVVLALLIVALSVGSLMVRRRRLKEI